MSLLRINNLSIAFGKSEVVHDISFHINAGETLAIVGESGSGKSVSASAIANLLPKNASVSGSILFKDRQMIGASAQELQEIRGNEVSFIFQEPMVSLNPLHTIAKQIGECLRLHQGLTGKVAEGQVISLLEKVGIQNPETRLRDFPHQLSGGQRQRVMIAMALANRPKLLIADEPTTALDVTIEKQILTLLRDLQKSEELSMLFITHDLGVVRNISDRVVVMEQGRIKETASSAELFAHPKHPYTKKLLAAAPEGEVPPVSEDAGEVFQLRGLQVYFPIKRGLLRRTVDHVKAVENVDFTLREGETLGVVGESGSGKTTLALAAMRLIASKGSIQLKHQELQSLSHQALRPLRSKIQMVFQDPFGSLSPRLSVGQIIGEGLEVHGDRVDGRKYEGQIDKILEEVGLEPDMKHRFPHEFSGGQRQRIAIARAMILRPEVIVLDEPTSALDMTVQVQILGLLRELQKHYGMAYIFISHDLRVIRSISHKILVMHQGKVVEFGDAHEIFDAPKHAYTQKLLGAFQ